MTLLLLLLLLFISMKNEVIMKTKLYNFIELVRQFYCKIYEGILVDAQHITLNAPHYHKRTPPEIFICLYISCIYLFNVTIGLLVLLRVRLFNQWILWFWFWRPYIPVASGHNLKAQNTCLWNFAMCTQGIENIESIFETCMCDSIGKQASVIALHNCRRQKKSVTVLHTVLWLQPL